MKRVSKLIFVFSLLITGCGLGTFVIDAGSNFKTIMPNEMPNDFDFSVQFGVQSKNEINTFEDKVTKDLIVDGTATITITFTPDEMTRIYEKMRDIDIAEDKELVPKNANCRQTPYGEDIWKIQLDGETKSLFWTGEYCERTKDAKQLIELRNYILNIVESKDEYKKLPEANGGYQ